MKKKKQITTYGAMFRLVEKLYGNNAAVDVMMALGLDRYMYLVDWVRLLYCKAVIPSDSPAWDLFWELAGHRPNIQGLWAGRKLKGDAGSYKMMLRFIAADKGLTLEELMTECEGKQQGGRPMNKQETLKLLDNAHLSGDPSNYLDAIIGKLRDGRVERDKRYPGDTFEDYRSGNIDEDATDAIMAEAAQVLDVMQKTLKAQSRLLMAYRTGGKPPEWVFDTLEKARKAELEI